MCSDQHISTGEDFARVTLGNDLFFDGAGVAVFVKVVIIGPGIVRGVEIQQAVGRVTVDKNPFGIRVPAVRRSPVLILVHLLRGDQRHLGAETIVDVINLADGQRHITRRFNRCAMVVQRLRLTGGKTTGIDLSADSQRTVAVDQRMIAVVYGVCANIHTLTPGEGRRFSALSQVIQRGSLQREMVAIDTAGARVR